MQTFRHRFPNRNPRDDLGLVVRRATDYFSIESTQFILKAHTAEAIQTLAAELNAPSVSILTYLANTAQIGTRELPYSTISAIDAGRLGSFDLIDGSLQLGDNGILLNAWAARRFASAGRRRVKIAYYEVAPGEKFLTRWATFQLKGIVAMTGLGADETLSPDYPGLGDATDMADWEAPFPIDLTRVRPRDENYWDTYRDAPKAFVSAATGAAIVEKPIRRVHGIRIGPIDGQSLETTLGQFLDRLPMPSRPNPLASRFSPSSSRALPHRRARRISAGCSSASANSSSYPQPCSWACYFA